jgi:hypothetical protein
MAQCDPPEEWPSATPPKNGPVRPPEEWPSATPPKNGPVRPTRRMAQCDPPEEWPNATVGRGVLPVEPLKTRGLRCPEVLPEFWTPAWVDAVVGVQGLTFPKCVHALVRGSPTVGMAEDVHMRLQFLDKSEREHFEYKVCIGKSMGQRTLEWLSRAACAK